MIRKTIGIAISLVLIVAVAAAYWVTDANRLKPEIVALLAEHTDYQVEFEGDLSWELLPPLTLSAVEVVAQRDDETIRIGQLDAKVDLSAMWQNVDAWKVTALTLENVQVEAPHRITDITSFGLKDFAIGEPARFATTLNHLDTSDPSPAPIPLDARGTITFWPADDTKPQRYAFKVDEFVSRDASGRCDGSARERSTQVDIPSSAEDVLPIDTLLNYNFEATCTLRELQLSGETFKDANLAIANSAGQLGVQLSIEDFLGGAMDTVIEVAVTPESASWSVLPQLQGVDSQRLLALRGQRFDWIATLGADATITMQGNTTDALAQSVKAQSNFEGGEGQLNVSRLKQQLRQIAALTGQTEAIADWPDVWDYTSLAGDWSIDGKRQSLRIDLDHLSVEADGEYDYLSDAVDMLAHVTIGAPPEGSPYRIHPLLEGTPLPLRCRGKASEAKCRLDSKATQQLVSRALTRDDDSGLRRKLEEKIDEEVPEQYRDVARDLLDLLGRSLERD